MAPASYKESQRSLRNIPSQVQWESLQGAENHCMLSQPADDRSLRHSQPMASLGPSSLCDMQAFVSVWILRTVKRCQKTERRKQSYSADRWQGPSVRSLYHHSSSRNNQAFRVYSISIPSNCLYVSVLGFTLSFQKQDPAPCTMHLLKLFTKSPKWHQVT